MPQDIAESVYCYLARDWGLAKDELTETKCEQLRTSIPQLRLAYHGNRAIAYHKPTVRRAYLAAFAPRYAYVLYRSLQKVRARALEVLRPWHRKEGVMCMLGGGPACEIFGLLDWLYQHDIEPPYLRVRPPADSVRGVTVGSIAHVDRPNSRVRAEEPSPFSRRGPGACFLPKPELVHYGGNCDDRGQYQQTGVLSLNGTRHLAENVGTSFATPLVSTLLANIHDALGPDASHVLSKAILIHSAILRAERLQAKDLRYKGFGVPNNLIGALTCDPHTATLIFEPGEVRPGREFVKGDFPIPQCLRTAEGKVRGEFVITLAYDPPLDLAYGAEYCRRNVEVSLGTYNPSAPKAEHQKKIPCEPRDISKLYEKHLVEHGFKWSPVKVYREDFPRGTAGDHWRVVVSAEDRKGASDPQPTTLALIVTIRDPERQLPVYDEVVARMAQSGWITQDLRVSERVRARVRR